MSKDMQSPQGDETKFESNVDLFRFHQDNILLLWFLSGSVKYEHKEVIIQTGLVHGSINTQYFETIKSAFMTPSWFQMHDLVVSKLLIKWEYIQEGNRRNSNYILRGVVCIPLYHFIFTNSVKYLPSSSFYKQENLNMLA